MANQHQDPNRPRPAGTPGTKGDPPSRQPGEYPETTPDVIAGNAPGRANAKNPKGPGGPGTEDKHRPGDSNRSRNQDSRRPGGPDRWSGDESRPASSDDEPIDRQ